MAAKKKQALKQKTKKKWFSIYAPKIFNNVLVGETHLDSVEKLKGKFISANLSTLTGEMKKQNISLTLRVNKVIDGQGYTEIISMKILQGHLKRLVRRGRTKIEDSFVVKTKDDVLIRVKPLVITTNNCTRTAASTIRVQTKTLITQRLSQHNFASVVHEILSFKLQKSIKQSMAKVVPIKSVDIRVLERETQRGKVPELELSDEVSFLEDKKEVEEPVSEDVKLDE